MGQAQNQNPLVSVIVPVYGVEPYLRECVDSVLGQTYRNLEVLLIDDGSPDGCPALCDAYASQDERVRVLHRPNGGLSDARNAALDIACGDLIGFVDSDDVIAPTMFGCLVKAMAEHGAQISSCGYWEFNERGRIKERVVSEPLVLNAHDALCLLAHDHELQNYVWNKLFDARLWDGVRFPVGQKYEDVNTTYKLVRRAGCVAILPEALYGYRVREDGIVGSRSLSGELDCIRANWERWADLRDECPEVAEVLVDGVLKAGVNTWPLIWEHRRELANEQRVQLDEFSRFVAAHAGESGLAARLGITGRMTLKACEYAKPWSWCAAWLLDGAYRMKHDGRTR